MASDKPIQKIPVFGEAAADYGIGVAHDPTHGRIDKDIQEQVEAMNPRSLGSRVAMENTLQEQRDAEKNIGVTGEVTYDPSRVRLRLIDIPPEIQGSNLHTTLHMMTEVFEECLNLVAQKSMGYGQAWREQGWMGNAARIMSKAARLKGLIWRETPQVMEHSAYESIEDTAMDSINLNAFFLLNRRTSNKWGPRA